MVSGAFASSLLFNVFWLVSLVWLLNAYNFMDGIDGFAAAETVFVSGAAALLIGFNTNAVSGDMMLALLIMASTAGFLFWNIPPARIFMGDVGSGFLGLILGVLAILTVRNGSLSMWVWVILLGVFVVDATITVLRRMIRGVRWHEAHRSHAYQHAARRWKSHGKVTVAISLINIFWLLPWSLAAFHWPHFGVVFATVALTPLVYLALRLDAGIEERL